MKKFLIVLVLIACMASIVNAGLVYDNDYYKKHISALRTGGQNDPFRRHLVEVDALLFPATGNSTVWYVDSNVTTAGDGTSWSNAFATIQEGADAASAGDFVDVAEAHNEAIIAADGIDIETAGITIRGYGSGTRMPTIDYDHLDGEFVIGAANVTLINLRFNASVTIVTHAIDVENAGDYATIAYCEFPDGEAAGTDEFVDTIQVGTTATDFTAIGNNYFSTGANSNNFIDLSAATIANATIVGNTIYGAFAEAGIWAGAAVPTRVMCAYNTVTNTTSVQLGIEFAGNATGWLIDNLVSTDVIGTSYDPGRMSDSGNMWDDFDTYDTSAVPWTTNETGVNRWGATELAQIEAECFDALEDTTTLIAGKTYSMTMNMTAADSDNLFDVAGGPILITSLTFYCTTDVDGQNIWTIFLDHADKDIEFTTAVDIVAANDGDRIVFSSANPSVLIILALTDNVGSSNLMSPWFCPIGMIEVNNDDSAQAGVFDVYMTFIPLTSGVTVTPQ